MKRQALTVLMGIMMITPLSAATYTLKNEGFHPIPPDDLSVYKVVIVPTHSQREQYLRLTIPPATKTIATVRSMHKEVEQIYITQHDCTVAVCKKPSLGPLIFKESIVITIRSENNSPECIIESCS